MDPTAGLRGPQLALGYWQHSRVYAVSRDAVRAAEYGQRSLEANHEQGPFLSAYEHESLPRAAAVDGDAATKDIHLAEARALLGDVTDPEERALLEADLRGIAP